MTTAEPAGAATEPLSAETSERIIGFARAAKTAARAVVLYPADHPTVGAALAAMAAVAEQVTVSGPVRFTVTPDTLRVDGRQLAKPDLAVSELAALLHAHQIGGMTIRVQTDADLWRRFLALLARAPDQARLSGGLSRLWASEGESQIELHRIDFNELLRERIRGDRATWERLVAECLNGTSAAIDSWTADLFSDLMEHHRGLGGLVTAIHDRIAQAGSDLGGGAGPGSGFGAGPGLGAGGDSGGSGDSGDRVGSGGGPGFGGPGTDDGAGTGTGAGSSSQEGAAVLAGLLRAVAEFAGQTQPGGEDAILAALADATARLPVTSVGALMKVGRSGRHAGLGRFIIDLANRVQDGTIADMVETEVRGGRGTSRSLADAFCGLAPDPARRATILNLARRRTEPAAEDAAMPEADAPAPEPSDIPGGNRWRQASDFLLTYSDERFVSDAYDSELRQMTDRAIELDRDTTDPPDRVERWTDTVDEANLRQLDVRMLIDLMNLQCDVRRWRELADLAIARVDVLTVVGDFDTATLLVASIRAQGQQHADPAVQSVASGMVDHLVTSTLMRHVAALLDTPDRSVVASATRFCHAIGTGIVAPLAEVLSREERTRARQHLIDILLGLGASGRQAVERLKSSPNAAVRRTAVLLLREFGGHEALTDLESLLKDAEPHVQRDATRAIAMMHSDAAYTMLAKALVAGTDRARAVITGVLSTIPNEDAVPALSFLVRHAPCRGPMWEVYERAVQRLGMIGGRTAVDALNAVVDKRVAWAPFKVAVLRQLAVDALARIASPEAIEALQQAARSGLRGARSTARRHLAAMGTKPSVRESR